MYMKDALAALDTFVDPSDPDLDEENSIMLTRQLKGFVEFIL